MKERPIIFNAEMVRAVLEGRKVQTRRILEDHAIAHAATNGGLEFAIKHCPYGQPGDRLWVREKWCKPSNDLKVKDRFNHPAYLTPVLYAVDDDKEFIPLGGNWHQRNIQYKWHPSIHMPRWASRITLEIVSIRVERLNDISPEDAEEEGIGPKCECKGRFGFFEGGGYVRDCGCQDSKDGPFIEEFKNLWQSIYGSESWNKNPWVWVIEFKRR